MTQLNKTQFTINETIDRLFPIYFYRKHLDVAAKDLLGLKLSPHHSLVLRDWGLGKPINLFFASRGMGKTILLAILYVLRAILYPNLKQVAAAGQGYRGSKIVLYECEKIIKCHLGGQENVQFALGCVSNPKKIILKDPSYWSIDFTNGSSILGIPLAASTEGDSIRGIRCHTLGQDEAFLISSNLYQAVLDPMMNVLYDPSLPEDKQPIKNMSIAISTCDYTYRDFYMQYAYYKSLLENVNKEDLTTLPDEVVDKTLSANDVSVYEFNLEDTFYKTSDGRRIMTWGINYERILQKLNIPTTDISLWNSENKNIPLNLQGGYFPYDCIVKGQEISFDREDDLFLEPLESCSAYCLLGVDTAPSGDNTALVVIKVGALNNKERDISKCATANLGEQCSFYEVGKSCKLKNYVTVVYAFEKNKMSQQERVKLIYNLMEKFNIVSVAMDSRGGGYELSDLLADADYLMSLGINKRPIYDPTYKTEVRKGMPILKLYATTQEQNMLFNGYMRGIIENMSLIFPRPLRYHHENTIIFESAGHIETLVSQLVRVKAIPAGKGAKFDIESVDPRTGKRMSGKKDLYSALLYAVGRMRELIDEELTNIDYSTLLDQVKPMSLHIS